MVAENTPRIQLSAAYAEALKRTSDALLNGATLAEVEKLSKDAQRAAKRVLKAQR